MLRCDRQHFSHAGSLARASPVFIRPLVFPVADGVFVHAEMVAELVPKRLTDGEPDSALHVRRSFLIEERFRFLKKRHAIQCDDVWQNAAVVAPALRGWDTMIEAEQGLAGGETLLSTYLGGGRIFCHNGHIIHAAREMRRYTFKFCHCNPFERLRVHTV